jgi:Pyruvate phosphate dikinase, AMP/ATP-binding domain
MRAFLLGFFALLLACSPAGVQPPLDPRGTAPLKVLADGLATTAIDGEARFTAMAYRDGGLLLPGTTLKFLIDRRDPSAPSVYFMNSNHVDPDGKRPDAARYHFHLAQRVLPGFSETLKSFSAVTYDVEDKRYIAGSIQTYFVDGAREPLYGIQFFPQDVIKEAGVVEAVSILLPRLRLPGAKLAFVATGRQQVVSAPAAARLAALGVPGRSLDDVLGSVDFIPLNRGEAWGYLRMFPRDPDALSALDIPVFDELPLDLSVVAGTITHDYQDPTSHVNLKSKERGTPNMVLRSAGPEHAQLSGLIDRPVHLTVEVDGFRLEAATDAEVRAKHAERSARPWLALPYEPYDELPSYAEMCPRAAADCLRFTNRVGGKAASLGFLTSPEALGQKSDARSLSARYGYDLVPAGLGVPFKLYRDFIGHPPNKELRRALEGLIDAAKRGDLTPKELSTKAEAARELFYAATFPDGMVERVAAKIAVVLPGVPKVKVRSSANAEDMPNFDGAGLYTSFAANLTKSDEPDGACRVVPDGVKLKVKPKTLACAMKGVFASLWNKRAIDERSFARLDHGDALMGIAIVADYDLEEAITANSVVVTRVINSPNVYGYTLATQQGNLLVTNPEPGTLAENVIAAFNEPGEPASFAVTRFATPVAGKPPLTRSVLGEKALRQLVEITRTAEEAYCRARPDYYAHDCRYAPADPDKTRALDFELKYLESGRFVCKQMREFSGR